MKINPIIKEILEWILCFIIAIVLALTVRFFIGTPTIVQQPSMYPTLKPNNRLWLNRWDRTTKTLPERGDIITFQAPSTIFLSENQINTQNPVALYEKDPEGWFGKFIFYVLEINKTSYIKRVIALPGEHVQITDGNVYINGQKLQEDYLQSGIVTDVDVNGYSDFIVPENCIFAMGDNRTKSTDCRAFGCIPLEKIESRVFIRIWPLNVFGRVK